MRGGVLGSSVGVIVDLYSQVALPNPKQKDIALRIMWSQYVRIANVRPRSATQVPKIASACLIAQSPVVVL